VPGRNTWVCVSPIRPPVSVVMPTGERQRIAPVAASTTVVAGPSESSTTAPDCRASTPPTPTASGPVTRAGKRTVHSLRGGDSSCQAVVTRSAPSDAIV
jgi:hypothetical protein